MIDSFVDTMDRNDREVLGAHPDRLSVTPEGFHPVDGTEIATITKDPTVGSVQPVLRVGARLTAPGSNEPIDLMVDVTDLDGSVWAPTLVRGQLAADRGGLVISAEAASDLAIGPGDVVTVEHPATRAGGLEMVRTDVRVAAVHPSPFRFATYLDRTQLSELGLPDVVNQLYVLPAKGATTTDVQRALFETPGVASAQPVSTAGQVVKDSIDEFVGVLRVLEDSSSCWRC
jgi:hypothetical protein